MMSIMDKGWHIGVVFLDLKKAFDTVNQNVLINKLFMYDFSKDTIMWFTDYLENRIQFAKVIGCISPSVVHHICYLFST